MAEDKKELNLEELDEVAGGAGTSAETQTQKNKATQSAQQNNMSGDNSNQGGMIVNK